MINRALNQKTGRHLDYGALLDLARDIGYVGVESRNDLGRPLFDGASASFEFIDASRQLRRT